MTFSFSDSSDSSDSTVTVHVHNCHCNKHPFHKGLRHFGDSSDSSFNSRAKKKIFVCSRQVWVQGTKIIERVSKSKVLSLLSLKQCKCPFCKGFL